MILRVPYYFNATVLYNISEKETKKGTLILSFVWM